MIILVPVRLLILSILLLFITATSVRSNSIISDWIDTRVLPETLASHGSITKNNTISVIGGANASVNSPVFYTVIGGDGNLESWSEAVKPPPLFWHSVLDLNGFAYLLAGSKFPVQSLNTVYVGKIEDNGEILNWEELVDSPLPKRLSLGGAVVVDDRLYFAGGFTDDELNLSQEIYMAQVTEDGSLQGWEVAGSLPEPMSKFGMVEFEGKLYVIGGYMASGDTSSSWSAEINSITGAVGAWSEEPNLPQALSRSSIGRAGNTIVSVGGISGFEYLDAVYWSEIDGVGNMGDWQTSSHPFPRVNCCSPLAVWGNNIYITGGHDGNNYYQDVYWAKVGPETVPTPTPVLPNLEVPYIRQAFHRWGGQEYDQASNWSTAPTISRWGCALTSTSMILNFFGHEQDPGTLNTWLKSQPDGFIRNGLVNWLAISRYTRERDTADSPTLEYRAVDTDYEMLVEKLNAGLPIIAKEPGHFVVIKSQTSDSFGINDPGYPDKLTLADYGNTLLGGGVYIPTHSDLSYLQVITDEWVELTISGPDGQVISDGEELAGPLLDDLGGTEVSGLAVKIFAYPKPVVGDYMVKTSGQRQYRTDVYLYGESGEVKMLTLDESEQSSLVNLIQVTVGGEGNIQVVEGVEGLITEWAEMRKNGQVPNKAIYAAIRTQLKTVKRMTSKNILKPMARQILTNIAKQVRALSGRGIERESGLEFAKMVELVKEVI